MCNSENSSNAYRLPTDIKKILNEFDALLDDFNESTLRIAIERQAKKLEERNDSHELAIEAEVATLIMYMRHGQKHRLWKTQFLPLVDTTKEDGSCFFYPDITEFDEPAIEYLKNRASEANHPVLRARYADFLWDITYAVTGNHPSIELARQAIDSYIRCGTQYPSSFHTKKRLSRALELALSIHDVTRSSKVVDTMLGILNKTGSPGPHIRWLFDTLTKQKNITLSKEQEGKLIDALEAELARICDSENAVGIIAKAPAIRLACYYERVGQPEDVTRVIRTYGNALANFAMKADGLVAMDWLQDAYATYVQFGMKNEAESLQIAAKEKGKDAEKHMVHHSFSVEIPAEDVERVIEEMTADDLESTLSRISINFCPSLDELKEQLKDLKKNANLLSMVSQSTLEDQQVTARVGSVDDDPEGWLMLQMGQYMQFMATILGRTIDHAREKYDFSADSMWAFLSQSELFDDSRLPLIKHAINAYLSEDHITAIHVLVPQIEAALRRVLPILGKPTNKHRRSDAGVMVEKTLNDILENDPAVTEFFGEDFVFYLRMFLCDPRGWNIRNRMCHGLSEADCFNRGISDRLLHILWSLGSVRQKVGE